MADGRALRAGESVEDYCRACKTDRMHTIIAVDIDDRKLELAKQFGATHTVNSKTTNPVEYIRSVTGGNGADVCIEAIGHPEVYKQAFEARDLAGTVVLVGVPRPDMTLELPFIEVFGRGGQLKSSWYGDCLPSRDFPMLVDLYLQGRLDLRVTDIARERALARALHDEALAQPVVGRQFEQEGREKIAAALHMANGAAHAEAGPGLGLKGKHDAVVDVDFPVESKFSARV